MRDFPPNHYTFMSDFPPNHYTFMRDFPPNHNTFTRDFSHKDAVKAPDTKSGCTCPKAHATASYISFYYYCLSKLTFTL